MSPPETRKRRPRQEPPSSKIANASLVPLGDPLDEIAAHVDGAFVLVVRVTGERYRRRCFLTAASAERAALNALAAGHDAQVFLAELKPLWRLTSRTAVRLGGRDG